MLFDPRTLVNGNNALDALAAPEAGTSQADAPMGLEVLVDGSGLAEGGKQRMEPSVVNLAVADPPTAPAKREKAKVSANDLAAFRVGFPWLRDRLEDLLAAGWSRAELFRRNRARRGIAWLAMWVEQGVVVELTASGFVRFTIGRGDRTCTQTARARRRHGGACCP